MDEKGMERERERDVCVCGSVESGGVAMVSLCRLSPMVMTLPRFCLSGVQSLCVCI